MLSGLVAPHVWYFAPILMCGSNEDLVKILLPSPQVPSSDSTQNQTDQDSDAAANPPK